MTKLIFIDRYFYTNHCATSRMLSDLAFAMAEDGDVKVNVVTSCRRYEDSREQLPAQEVAEGVTIHRIWTPSVGRRNLLGRALDYLSYYGAAFLKLLSLAGKHSIVVKTDPTLESVIEAKTEYGSSITGRKESTPSPFRLNRTPCARNGD